MPIQESINKIKHLLSGAFGLLNANDRDLVDLAGNEVIEFDLEVEKHERKLHEVCINHRLAYYIEALLPNYFDGEYKIDIEYNRYYRNKKHLSIAGVREIVRPDIIVHTRTKHFDYPQHLLVIEAKKDMNSSEDAEVVKSFIKDVHYRYVFGATIRYNDFNPIQATLFYEDGNQNIQSEDV